MEDTVKATLIYLDNGMVITKKIYSNWRDVQDEYRAHYMASLDPWPLELFIEFFKEDFGPENQWPFSREELLTFFESDLEVLCSSR